MGELVDLGGERQRRAQPCPECGGLPPDPIDEWLEDLEFAVLAGYVDEEGWTPDPEQDPRILGELGDGE